MCTSGGCDASKESILYNARKAGGGNAVILVVGGAEESLEARPGAYKLTLRKRKGFVKLALRSGYMSHAEPSNSIYKYTVPCVHN